MNKDANWRPCTEPSTTGFMKNLFVIFVLIGSAAGYVRGDPNIYGPDGVNLGPNGDISRINHQSEQDRLLEEERKKTRLLQDQVQQLQQQVEQLLQLQQQQAEMQSDRQNQIQLEFNYSYPPQQNFGWVGGIPFFGSGFREARPDRKHHGGDGHHVKNDRRMKGRHDPR